MESLFTDNQIIISTLDVKSNNKTIPNSDIASIKVGTNLRWWQVLAPAILGMVAILIMTFVDGKKASVGAFLGILSAGILFYLLAKSEKYIYVIDKQGTSHRVYTTKDERKIRKIKKLIKAD